MTLTTISLLPLNSVLQNSCKWEPLTSSDQYAEDEAEDVFSPSFSTHTAFARAKGRESLKFPEGYGVRWTDDREEVGSERWKTTKLEIRAWFSNVDPRRWNFFGWNNYQLSYKGRILSDSMPNYSSCSILQRKKLIFPLNSSKLFEQQLKSYLDIAIHILRAFK